MTSRSEVLFDGNEEKKLSEIDQLVVCATHVQVHQRHLAITFIVNNLSVLCKHDIKKLFVVIDTLQKDQAISVRSLLAGKLFEIGSYFSGHSKLGRYITSDLYDVIYKSLTDCSSQVRRACYDSVFSLLNVNSIPHSLVEKTLLSVVLESTASENDDEHRADGVLFLLGLAPYMTLSIVTSTVLPLFVQLASDPSFHVRRACSSCYSDMCRLVGTETTEALLLEKFANLCEDNVWAVRKACVASFPGVASHLSSAVRASQMTELYLKLLRDQSRWVRLMSYQVLGEFIATFRFDPPQDLNSGDRRNDGEREETRADEDSIVAAKVGNVSNNRIPDAVRTGKINLSFRSDSNGDDGDSDVCSSNERVHLIDGDGALQDELVHSTTSAKPFRNHETSASIQNKARAGGNGLASPPSRKEDDERDIFVSNFSEFVVKMFGDADRDDGDERGLSSVTSIGAEVMDRSNFAIDQRSVDDKTSDARSHERMELDLDVSDVCSETISVQDPLTPESTEAPGETDKDARTASPGTGNNRKHLLRSAPVLLLLDAASVEEAEAPVFETALNFGTAHHRVRSKPTAVRFGEEGGPNEADAKKHKSDDFAEDDDLLSIEDSNKLETADDFSKTCLTLPEEAVASRPLSPVTCRTLKAGGGRWCRQTMVYVTSKDGFGKRPPVSLGRMKKSGDFKQCPVPGKLLDVYLEMSDSYLSEFFDSDIQLHCAFCFPAVALTLGRTNWPSLREVYTTMVASSQVKVRRTLSYSIHEMAVILGDDVVETDLLTVFDDFCCDVDDVKMGVVEHLYDFIKLLPMKDKLKYINKLPGMTTEENGRNWRIRDVVIRELEKILDLLSPEQVHVHLVPLVFTFMSDQVAVVRESAIKLMSKIIFIMSKMEEVGDDATAAEEKRSSSSGVPPIRAESQENLLTGGSNVSRDRQLSKRKLCSSRSLQEGLSWSSSYNLDDSSPAATLVLHKILDDLVQKFANSSNFRQRQSFILACHQLLNIPRFVASNKIFSPNFLLNPLLALHSDAIVNVRITLCRVLYNDFPKIASLEYIRKNPTCLLDPINKFWNDSDPDVHRLAEKFLSLIVH